MKTKLLFITILLSIYSNAKDIYVSVSTGDDNNPGTEALPYKTISKASSVAVAGDVIIIGQGTYEETLEPRTSGEAGNPITYRSKAGEKVIITAMQAINNWTLDKDNVYKSEGVNWNLGQDNMALHNDKLMDLARWPNNVAQDIFMRDDLPGADGGSLTSLNYDAGIPNWDWSNGGSVHFYGGAGFLAWTNFIKTSTTNKITFDFNRNQNWIPEKHHPGYTGHGIKKGEFFLQGIKEALDYKNEWYYDKTSKTLYAQIDGGEKPVDGSIQFRRRINAINITKNYIHVENIAVFGGTINLIGDNNKLYGISSFYGNHTLGVITSFDSRRQSILIRGENNIIDHCEVAWGAGNGVFDKGTNTRLTNSFVHHFNYLGKYDCVLNTRGAKQGKYLNNTLTFAGRDIIQAYVIGGEFAYNDISHSNKVADDCGLLYTTNVRSEKSSIHHNTFHDSKARKGRFKAAGIYLDNDSKNWDVHHNVVWNTQWTNVQINWNGTNLKIYNNTLVKGSATMGAWHKDGTQFSNVEVWNNITDEEAVDAAGNQESESTWEPQSDKQNNLVSKNSFIDWEANNFELKQNAQAVDFGRVITGYTDGFQGANPDVGAYEYGVPAFKTGIDWQPKVESAAGSNCYNLPGETCTQITNSNFTILTTGITCPGKTNGKISITTEQALNYTATINEINNTKEFSDSIDFNELAPGTYNLCITESDFNIFQCYKLVINDVEEINVTSNLSSKSLNLKLSGSDFYRISQNNTTIVTDQSEITLNLEEGTNTISVSTDKDCQGSFSEKIIVKSENEHFKTYPNPVVSNLYIQLNNNTDKEIIFELHSINGTFIKRQKLQVHNNLLSVDLSTIPSGLYLARINGSNSNLSETLKLIKQ